MGLAYSLAEQYQAWSDDEVIRRVLDGETAAYELLIRRYNQRVYRIIRSILRDDSESEDVMQEAYVRAFQHLSEFEHRSSFSTWLGRIAVHEALARAGRAKRYEALESTTDSDGMIVQDTKMSPEQQAALSEARNLLERALLSLPTQYRVAIILRDVEEMTTAEAAETLDLTEEALKVRLHRARGMLRKELYSLSGAASVTAFQFHASRCDRVSQRVMETILAPNPVVPKI